MRLGPLSLFCAMLAAATPAFAADTAEQTLESLKWVARPIVVFADSPNDPRLAQQLQDFEARMSELEERDVVILIDTAPAERGPLRLKFRPRDFVILVIGKDGEVKYRKSDPVTVREVVRLIDRMPLRRQELEAKRHGGGAAEGGAIIGQ